MRFCSLGSGSSGNATLVEATSGITTTRLLIDAGFSLRTNGWRAGGDVRWQVRDALSAVGSDIAAFQAAVAPAVEQLAKDLGAVAYGDHRAMIGDPSGRNSTRPNSTMT